MHEATVGRSLIISHNFLLERCNFISLSRLTPSISSGEISNDSGRSEDSVFAGGDCFSVSESLLGFLFCLVIGRTEASSGFESKTWRIDATMPA